MYHEFEYSTLQITLQIYGTCREIGLAYLPQNFTNGVSILV